MMMMMMMMMMTMIFSYCARCPAKFCLTFSKTHSFMYMYQTLTEVEGGNKIWTLTFHHVVAQQDAHYMNSV